MVYEVVPDYTFGLGAMFEWLWGKPNPPQQVKMRITAEQATTYKTFRDMVERWGGVRNYVALTRGRLETTVSRWLTNGGRQSDVPEYTAKYFTLTSAVMAARDYGGDVDTIRFLGGEQAVAMFQLVFGADDFSRAVYEVPRGATAVRLDDQEMEEDAEERPEEDSSGDDSDPV